MSHSHHYVQICSSNRSDMGSSLWHNRNIPCWEKEFDLFNISEAQIMKKYNYLCMSSLLCIREQYFVRLYFYTTQKSAPPIICLFQFGSAANRIGQLLCIHIPRRGVVGVLDQLLRNKVIDCVCIT